MTSPAVPVPHRVVTVERENDDVVTLGVVPVTGTVPPFRPAQFSMIGVAGIGEVPISISGSCDGTHRYTIRRAGAVTAALCDAPPGAVVTVRGPFGRAWDLDRAADRAALFVAGGIGLAPLRAAIETLVEPGTRARSVTVLAGWQSPGARLFPDWLDELAAGGVDVRQTVEHPTPGWVGPVGLVTELVEPAVPDPSVVAYACGPDAMMAATVRSLDAAGVPAANVQVTLERNMHCANGWCGHCQLGPVLVCRDGPVVDATELGALLEVAEL